MPDRQPLIIVGAGGFGLEVAAYAADMTQTGHAGFAIKGFLDDTKPAGTLHAGYPVLGGIASAIDNDVLYIIAVGQPAARRQLAATLGEKGARFATICHPLSYIAAGAEIGVGTVVAPFAFIGPAARIGHHCLLNVSAMAGHECRMDDYTVMAPQSSLQGRATLGAGSFMGGHACVTPGVHVGADVTIAAGAVVYNPLPDGVAALGNPAAFRMANRN